jgi:rhodanese-related sulfurtransferase/polyhydroxyalkanoate synthesis regulator phasin
MDPEIGRFISEDPVAQDPSLYAYCGNNPLTRIDPSGMNWVDDAKKWAKDTWKKVEKWWSTPEGYTNEELLQKRKEGVYLAQAIVGDGTLYGVNVFKIYDSLVKDGKIDPKEYPLQRFVNDIGPVLEMKYKSNPRGENISREMAQNGEALVNLAFLTVCTVAAIPPQTATERGTATVERQLAATERELSVAERELLATERTVAALEKQGLSGQKPIVVVGQSMDRVEKIAQQLKDAGYEVQIYQPRNFQSTYGNLLKKDLENNRSWLSYWTKEKGATVIDIGVDPIKASKGITSPFYDLERRSLYNNWNYQNVINYNPGF